MNSYKLTLRKIESLAEASFHDALLAVILVTTMLFRVFSGSLDREKTWYALNDRLCGKQPRKFSKGSFFQLFPDEFLRVNFADLHDENGCPVSSQWFNKLNGQKSSDQVYVASTFAVVSCNIVLRNPSESEFLRSQAFLSLKRTINEHVLKESDIDHRPAQDLCCVSTDRDSKSDEGETPQELKGEKLSLESSFPGSPPKCSTPRRQSPPKFEIPLDHVDTSSSSSCDDSSQSLGSVSSISSLLNRKFGSAYKKKKIRQKVEAVMGTVESVCLEQGETWGEVVAQSR